MRVSLLAIVLGLGFTSCTAESLDGDDIEAVATDPNKKHPTPPTDPNG